MTLKQMKNCNIIKAFNEFKDNPCLYTDCLQGGCAERTRIICTELQSQGEDAGYILFPQSGWCDESLSCKAKLKNGQIHDFLWVRHFVPFVFNEQNEAIVFDVCLMDGAERFHDWKKHILFDGKPLEKEHYCFNHPNDIHYIDMMLRDKDPFINLAGVAEIYNDFPIIPNQIKSKWLAEQKAIIQTKQNKFYSVR